MKVKKYAQISIIVLIFASAALILALVSYRSGKGFLGGLNAGFMIGYYTSIVIIPIGIITSLVSVIKERTLLSVILFLIFLSPAVVVSVNFIAEHVEEKRDVITESELLDAYEKISGKRPLCLLDQYRHKYLLDVVQIESDTIGDGDILLQYEIANLHATNYSLKKLNKNISDYRDIIVIQYMSCEEDGYKVRYYDRCNYHYEYQKKNKSYNKIYETDDGYRYSDYHYEWRDLSRADYHHLKLLEYYEEHKSEIPVISEEKIKKKKTHVSYKIEDDKYELRFRTLKGYDKPTEYSHFAIIEKFLQEHYNAELFDAHDDYHPNIPETFRSVSVKTGNSILTLHLGYYGMLLYAPLSDQSTMEQIAEDFEAYATDNDLTQGE